MVPKSQHAISAGTYLGKGVFPVADPGLNFFLGGGT